MDNVIDFGKKKQEKSPFSELIDKLDQAAPESKIEPIVARILISAMAQPTEQSHAANQCATLMGQALLNQFVRTTRKPITEGPDAGKNEICMVFDLHTKLYNLQGLYAKLSQHLQYEKNEYIQLMNYYEGIFDFIQKAYGGDGVNETKALYDAWVKNGGSAGEVVK